MPHTLRRLISIALVLGFLSLIAIFACDALIRRAADGSMFDRADQAVDAPRTALVLGCSPTLANGQTNRYFAYRIDAAVMLYEAGQLDHLIVSGDNGSVHYDEPTAMRAALVQRGVPDERIHSDFAGFRTLDSVVRARAIFDQPEILIISQKFHNERAIYLAKSHGIRAIGFNARDVEAVGGLKTRAREALARVKTVLDVTVLGTRPKFLGPQLLVDGSDG